MLAWRGKGRKRARGSEPPPPGAAGEGEAAGAARRPAGWLPVARVRDPRGLLGGQLSGGCRPLPRADGAGMCGPPSSSAEVGNAPGVHVDLAGGLDLIQLHGILVQSGVCGAKGDDSHFADSRPPSPRP